jgi:hypothetical protein
MKPLASLRSRPVAVLALVGAWREVLRRQAARGGTEPETGQLPLPLAEREVSR